MKQTDGYRDASVGVDNRLLQCGDTGVARQMSLRHGSGVVDDHAGVVEQSFHDVCGLLRGIEMFRDLQHIPRIIRHAYVVPSVDVDLLDAVFSEIRSKDRIPYEQRP